MPAKKSPPSPSPAPADVVLPSVALEDVLHSGHLHFLLRRARCGFKPAGNRLMHIYCMCTEKGKEPRPAVHAFIAEALGKMLNGQSANQAFKQMRDRAGNDKSEMKGDFPLVITDKKTEALLIKRHPGYRDWLIARDLRAADAGPILEPSMCKAVGSKYHVCERTVRRAWCKYVSSPSVNLKARSDYEQAVSAAHDQFNAFVADHRGRAGAKDTADKWRKRSVQLLRKLARDAAAASPEDPPSLLWSRGVVADPTLVAVLFLCLEQFEVDGHSARITEDEAKAEYLSAVDSARRRTLR
jgi:hypothetical protein